MDKAWSIFNMLRLHHLITLRLTLHNVNNSSDNNKLLCSTCLSFRSVFVNRTLTSHLEHNIEHIEGNLNRQKHDLLPVANGSSPWNSTHIHTDNVPNNWKACQNILIPSSTHKKMYLTYMTFWGCPAKTANWSFRFQKEKRLVKLYWGPSNQIP